MAFQNTVLADLVSGIPGEIAFNSPYTGIAAVINSASAGNNVYGRAMTYIDEAVETIGAGGTGKFAGLLVNPKTSAVVNIGDTADSVPNGTPVETMFEGECYALLGAGTAGAGQTQIVGAQVFRHNPSAANAPSLAVIRIKD